MGGAHWNSHRKNYPHKRAGIFGNYSQGHIYDVIIAQWNIISVEQFRWSNKVFLYLSLCHVKTR